MSMVLQRALQEAACRAQILAESEDEIDLGDISPIRTIAQEEVGIIIVSFSPPIQQVRQYKCPLLLPIITIIFSPVMGSHAGTH